MSVGFEGRYGAHRNAPNAALALFAELGLDRRVRAVDEALATD